MAYCLSKLDYQEFLVASSGIENALKRYHPLRKQVILFDDYWGSIFRYSKLALNEDKRLLDFMARVSKSANHLFILTSREFVLQQGGRLYLAVPNQLDFSKCMIGLEEFPRGMRKRILLNHLYFSDLKREQIAGLTSYGSYREITDHPHFLPRWIEVMIRQGEINEWDRYEFRRRFKAFLDNPYEGWQAIFEAQSDASKLIMMICLISGLPLKEYYLKETFDNCVKVARKQGLQVKTDEYSEALQALDGTLILMKPFFYFTTVLILGSPQLDGGLGSCKP